MGPAGISRIANVTGLDVIGIPVLLGVRPLARSVVISVGKGLSSSSARAGALMESIEGWYAENIEPDVRLVPFSDMLSAVDPATLPVALDSKPDQDLSRRPCDWIRGEDLRTGEETWVPFDIVSLDYRCIRLNSPWLARSSNGLASGNNRNEAILHGLCEVIERDAEWRWRFSDDSGRLHLDTVTDEVCIEILRRICDAGLYVACWDVTSLAGIPCFGCVVMPDPVKDTWGSTGAHSGFSCHPLSERALASAMLEAVQKRLTYISGSRDDLTRSEMARVASTDLIQRVWDDCLLEPQTVTFNEIAPPGPVYDTASLLQITLDNLGRAEFSSPVVVDLSGRGDEPAVVKVIVPGMHGHYGSCCPPPICNG